VAIDGYVRHPHDVVTERRDLEIASAVVRRRHPEVGMDRMAVGEFEPALAFERREPTLAEGSTPGGTAIRRRSSIHT